MKRDHSIIDRVGKYFIVKRQDSDKYEIWKKLDSRGKRKKFLGAFDHERTARVMVKMLSNANYNILNASD